MHTTSASLLIRLRELGESDSWARFVRLYSPMLYRWGRRLGLSSEDALDLVQDVFTSLIQKLPEFQYDDHKCFRAWLWTVTHNKWRDRNRRRQLPIDKRRPPEELSAELNDAVEEADFRQFLLCEILPTVKEHFQLNTWAAFWNHAVEGRTAASVAADLGMSESAVYKAKLRVTAHLHRELGDLIDE